LTKNQARRELAVTKKQIEDVRVDVLVSIHEALGGGTDFVEKLQRLRERRDGLYRSIHSRQGE